MITSKGKKHIKGYKELTDNKEVFDLTNDKEVASLVYFPLVCPNGKEVEVLVKEKDKVKVGTKLMIRSDFDVPVFSSVSGTVKGKEVRYCPLVSKNVEHLVIKNDYKYSQEQLPVVDIESSSKEDIVSAIKNAGIIGLGGAGFPTYIKYSSAAKINSVLINAVECEPYLTTDYVAIFENVKLLLEGAKILQKASGANEVVIAFKKNKKALKEVLEKEIVNYSNVRIALVKDLYPMGWEKHLVKAVFKKAYDKLPSEVGIVVNNAQTVISVAKALLNGECIHNRIITVSGNGINDPRNVLVPVGTLASEILAKCNGVNCESVSLLPGGPMTSKAAINDEFATYTQLGALTIMKEVKYEAEACLRCGKCIEHCPAGLHPIDIKNAFDVKDVSDLEKLETNKCVECGLCSYVCPSKIELTDAIKKAKLYIKLSQTKR